MGTLSTPARDRPAPMLHTYRFPPHLEPHAMTTILDHPTATARPARTVRTDDELVAALRAGDEDAFAVLVRRHQAALTAYARQTLGGASAHHDAEEAVQDAFVRALAYLRRCPERDITLRPWLYTIVRNVCLDRLRRCDRTVALDSVEGALPAVGSDPVAAAERREQLRVVVVGLHALPDRQRAALVGHELEGHTHAQLAATLGVSVGATKALVCRARQSMAHLRDSA